MILIYPPVAQPAQPPAGISKLYHALASKNLPCCVVDANVEGILYLLQQENSNMRSNFPPYHNLKNNLQAIKNVSTYKNFDNYKRIVRQLDILLAAQSASMHSRVSLTNFVQQDKKPVDSRDLLWASENPEKNPFYSYFKSELLPQIEKCQPDMIGISIFYLSQALPAFSLIGLLKKTFAGIKIVCGGGLITSWMSRPDWRNPFSGLCDFLVAGPGEKFVQNYYGENSVAHEIFRPDYSSFALGKYLSPGFVLPYSASSGCYWKKCSFCPETAEQNKFIAIPPARVLADIQDINHITKAEMVHFLDNAMSPALLRHLQENPLPIPWYGCARFTSELEDLDYCIALKKSGCMMLQLGLESGDQGILDQMQKGIKISSASRALQNLHRAGIGTFVYFLFGTPGESVQEARITSQFILEHHENIDFCSIAIFNLPLHGQESQNLELRPFYAGDLSLYADFEHPRGWDRKSVRHFLEGELKSNPKISGLLQKMPPYFGANHAAFFLL
jgi:hypothetical protein